MKIAIDFDNTIIDYSGLFQKAALLEGLEIDPSLSKNEIKEYIKNSNDMEWPKRWIEIQGRCYGELVLESPAAKGFERTYKFLKDQGHEIEIVSHKSLKSLCGRYNLRESALKKISELEISKESVKFFESSTLKCEYLSTQGFDILIDDLEEIIENTQSIKLKVLFGDTAKNHFSLNSFFAIYDLIHFMDEFNFPISSIESLGRNSYLIKSSTKSYFLKGFLNEQRSLRELKSLSMNVRPFVDVVYQTENLIVEEVMEFSEIKKIDEWFCSHYKRHFLALQEHGDEIDFQATHGISSELSYFSNLEGRISNLENLICSSLISRVKTLLHEIRAKVNPIERKIEQKLCMPDFFKDNFGRKDDELVIFDYESFGLDDLARTFLNATHHLGQSLERSEITHLMELFHELSKGDHNFWERVRKFYDLMALEWVLICAKNPENLTKSERLVTIMETHRDQNQDFWSWNKSVVDLIDEKFSK